MLAGSESLGMRLSSSSTAGVRSMWSVVPSSLILAVLNGAVGDGHLQHLPAEQFHVVRCDLVIAYDHLVVAHAEMIADQEHRRRLVRIEAGRAVETVEFRPEVGDAVVEHLEAAEIVDDR